MNKLWIVLILLALIHLHLSATSQTFCSVTCGRITCLINDTSPSGCTACNTGWLLIAGVCTPNTVSNYYLFDKTNDLGGGLIVSPSNIANTQCTGNYGPIGYNVYGWYNSGPSNTASVSSTGGITNSFYQMIVYFGILNVDKCQGGCGNKKYWKDDSFMFIDFAGGDGFFESNNYKLTGSTKVASGNYCFITDAWEKWNKFTTTYAYSSSNFSLTWTIYNNQTNATNKWGMKQFIVVYRRCNQYCLTCYGPAISQCNSCVYDSSTNQTWLSGTTCNETCLPQYGYSSIASFCILCDRYCKTCYDLSTYCFTCTISGQWAAFYYSANSSCLPTCPEGYFANRTTQTCDPCNSNCTGCINSANYCTACIANFYWYKFYCYDICPIKTFLETNLLNCTDCYPYCQVCINPYTLCTECSIVQPYIGYLYNATSLTGSCVTACPQGYYSENFNLAGPNLCLPCNASCFYCTGSPSPCQQCVAGYYLYNQVCYNPCPTSPTNLFASNASGTGQCLDCNAVCVDLTVSMYFSNALNNQIYIDMMFSQNLNFSSFDYKNFQTISIQSGSIQYTLDMFDVSYRTISGSTYRIILKPKGYIFLYNATFTVTTKAQDNTTDYSLIMMPFKTTNYLKTASLDWFLIQGPPYSQLQVNIMTSLATLSQKTLNFLDLPYLQQIKKTGVFLLLFSGAQITSCSVLSNQIQSQNLYQGVRFWATFVFFDAPPYQRISNQTKNFFSPSVQSQIRNALQISSQEQLNSKPRKLFSTDVMYWRFQRTGQTSFFIYDCYMPVFLIIICWIGLFILKKCKKSPWFVKHAPKIYSAVHKIHEISIIYVTMASIVQFIYFQPTSAQRFISAIVCVVFNVYFILYQLYIYYDMLKYPLAEIGNAYYTYYTYRYGYFLKNIRYQQYDIHQSWSPSHWFRPYNFHFLSYYKKFVMMIALPLFYSSEYAQMSILFGVQLLQVIRVWKIWPFVSTKRNYLRISLQIALLLFFFANIIQISLLAKIQSSDINLMGQTFKLFYGFGWAGFILCFYFNLTHVIICVYDFITGLKKSSRNKMDQARKLYYYQKIKSYQKDNEGANKQMVNKWVKLGNLNNQYHGQLPQINVRIEEYQMSTILGKFQVTVRKITQLRMMKKRNHKLKNNTVTTTKIQKKGVLFEHKNKELYDVLHGYYTTMANYHIETVVLKTFINVFQPDFSQDEKIPFDQDKMFQKVELISFDNEKQQKQLPQMLQGFPLANQLFQNF